jgi:aldehyde dehydrogenase (NAD+)
MTKTSSVREPRPAKTAEVTTFKNFVGGQWAAPSTGAYFDNRNPANPEDLIGGFPDSDQRDVDAAVRSAKRGFEIWS